MGYWGEVACAVKFLVLLKVKFYFRKIKDIVDFTNGTVIEINKEVTQPVDVLANNKLIAHGEIVVIEDNFGLRITEVLDMKELIASFQNGD